MIDCIKGLRKEYRNIYIIDSLDVWDSKSPYYCAESDLVLTFDLALKKRIESEGGDTFFLDHLVSNETMQKNNHLSYKFFDTWFLDQAGKDIFNYKGVSFGRAFQLEYWNDFTYYIRLYINVLVIKGTVKDHLEVVSSDKVLFRVLREHGLISAKNSNCINKSESNGFYFPISQWMNEKIRPTAFRGFLFKVRGLINLLYGHLMIFVDRIKRESKKTVFVQEYHPTKEILKALRGDKEIKLLLANLSRGGRIKDHLAERVLPITTNPSKFIDCADKLLIHLKQNKCQKLILHDGSDVTDSVYEIIESRISVCLSGYLSILDSSISYLDKQNVNLEIMISNIGNVVTLFDCACESRNIPSYLIINGLLGPEYSNESKLATFINAYSESIKDHYFRGMSNVMALGDPRMDMYSENTPKNIINYDSPTVVIGASGFNNVDLNSYVAVEFDFMFDVLTALSKIKKQKSIKVIIKTRPNGYKWQYEHFVEKYFKGVVDEIVDNVAMFDVLRLADFYISIYSQTLFEASCLGVPVVYYRKDNEIMDPPFDGKSELVTVSTIDELVKAFFDFQSSNERFSPFLSRDVMAKYVGPLDGNNLQRNLDFIYDLLEENNC